MVLWSVHCRGDNTAPPRTRTAKSGLHYRQDFCYVFYCLAAGEDGWKIGARFCLRGRQVEDNVVPTAGGVVSIIKAGWQRNCRPRCVSRLPNIGDMAKKMPLLWLNHSSATRP